MARHTEARVERLKALPNGDAATDKADHDEEDVGGDLLLTMLILIQGYCHKRCYLLCRFLKVLKGLFEVL